METLVLLALISIVVGSFYVWFAKIEPYRIRRKYEKPQRDKMRKVYQKYKEAFSGRTIKKVLLKKNSKHHFYTIYFEDGSVYLYKTVENGTYSVFLLYRVLEYANKVVDIEDMAADVHLEQLIGRSVDRKINGVLLDLEDSGYNIIARLSGLVYKAQLQRKQLSDGVKKREIKDYISLKDINQKIQQILGTDTREIKNEYHGNS